MNKKLTVPNARQKTLFVFGLLLIVAGFMAMILDRHPYGFGFWSLTAGPVLVLSGLSMQLPVIFFGIGFSWIKGAFRNPHTLAGWGVFILSLALYISTLEPTASLWDCSEYIACAYKLQIPHAPGNPLFTMLGRLFSLIALGHKEHVAFWVNTLSAVSSAATVMLVFWSIEMLAFKIKNQTQASNPHSHWKAIVSGLVGAGIFAVSDSFWFSAVEAETYALATFFTILPLWAALKWDRTNNPETQARWFLLIAYAYGLAIGAHPMALLSIPAVTLMIYLKSRGPSPKNLMTAGFLGIAILFFVNQVIVLGFPAFLKWFDIFMVNGLGLPFNSGVALGIIALAVGLSLAVRFGTKRQNQKILLGTYALIFIFVGFSTYFLVPIRSLHNPPIDENNPDNISSLVAYLNRDSYPTRPLLSGPYFDAQVTEYKKTGAVYLPIGHQYEITDHRTEAVYSAGRTTIFPRMYSNQKNHVATYQEWTGLRPGQKPGFLDNIDFLMRYQLGHMYWRYFMWNFSGRESDIQQASWLSPFSDIGTPSGQTIHNRARNNYFMLPFLLGILGLLFQWKYDRKSFYAILALFLFMGIVLVFYLNSTPNEPRERDYIYVGSYLAFALWTGLGSLAIFQWTKLWRKPLFGIAISTVILLIPTWMGFQNFDDHDRSGRYLQIDNARNILASCAPDAILFTGGDNDTFPLWYVQEVEGFRTDVRVIVLSYFNASWYIDQMTRRAYQSDPLPFSLTKENFRQGGLNDVLPYVQNPGIKGAVNLEKFLRLVRENHPALQVQMSAGDVYNSTPSKTFYLPVDTMAVKRLGIVPQSFDGMIPANLYFNMKGNYLQKNALMVLDIIATNHWKRPVYFNYTSVNTMDIDMRSHVVQTGSLYRLLPIEHSAENIPVDADKMYENLLVKAQFRDLDNKHVYYNTEDYQYRILQPMRSDLNTLAETMISMGNRQKSRDAVNFILDKLDRPDLPTNFSWLPTVQISFQLGLTDEGNALAQRIYNNATEQLQHYTASGAGDQNSINMQLYTLQQLQRLWGKYGNEAKATMCGQALLGFGRDVGLKH